VIDFTQKQNFDFLKKSVDFKPWFFYALNPQNSAGVGLHGA